MTAEDLAALALDLLRVPSPIGREGPLADLVEARVVALGPAVRRERLGNTVVARIGGAGAGTTIGLFGHLDTVAGHVADPVRRDGDRLYGCGASDMKGGLAVMLALLQRRARQSPLRPGEAGPSLNRGSAPVPTAGGAPASAAAPPPATADRAPAVKRSPGSARAERRGAGAITRPSGGYPARSTTRSADRAPADEGGAGLVCVFYDREEGPYAESGLETVLARSALLRPVDFAFCLEPTAGEVQVGCLGALHARVRFTGRAAHSARPWQGENAIHKAAPLLARIARLEPREALVGGLAYREVMSVTTARSHAVRNVVPDFFELNVNYRFAPGKSLAAARADVLAVVAGEAEVEFVDEAPAGPVALGDPILARFLAATGAPVAPKQAWTDVARLGAAGIPAVNYGPGEPSQAHQAGEWAPIAPLAAARDALARLVRES